MRDIRLLVFLLSLVFVFVGCNTEKKTGYIKNGEVLGDFKMSEDLQNRLAEIESQYDDKLDSLRNVLKLTYDSIMVEKDKKELKAIFKRHQHKLQEFSKSEKIYNEDLETVTNSYHSQILKLINEYVSDYGKEHGYAYIFGTTGNGNIMYADDSEDLTEKIKVYVNKRYAEKK